MAIPLAPIFKRAYHSLVLFGALYLLFVFALTFPAIQRNAIYAHRVNPTLWQNLSDVEAFGFLPCQVQPFTLVTPDHESLYAWHILPLHLAYEHSAALLAREDFGVKTGADVLDTVAFHLLTSDPNARVVLNFHGNAGHLASSYRPFTYQRLLGLSSKARPVHVIAFDYRGFGLSSGTPTEDGLITDAETMLTFLTGLHPPDPVPSQAAAAAAASTLSLPARSIILTSQSLGTAISTALLHTWTLQHAYPPPRALILTSPFSSLPSLLDSYSIKGVIPPLLSPFRSYTYIMSKITAYVADTWRTDVRLAELLTSDPDVPLHVEMLHAKDDREIPWWETQRLWDAVLKHAAAKSGEAGQVGADGVVDGETASSGGAGTAVWAEEGEAKGEGSHVQTWRRAPRPAGATSHDKSARFTRTPYGGHNRLAWSEEAAAAVWRALELT